MPNGWTVEVVNDLVDKELEAQPKDVRAHFLRLVNVIEGNGLVGLKEPYVKHVEGPLWEMRLKGRDGIARAIYVTAHRRRVIVLRVFTKKSEKTPRSEIEHSYRRMKEIK